MSLMRITGGSLRGRAIRVPGRAVRPAQDKVRQALFSILGERVPGCRFLDLFAGSGAVGLEAWSRGARSVWWVESERHALACLRGNVAALSPSVGRVVGMDVRSFLRNKAFSEERFDIIFADPPYAVRAWRTDLLEQVGHGGILVPGGLLVLEEAVNQTAQAAAAPGWEQADERRYGDTRLAFFCCVRGAAIYA
ncbi:MAG: 16S rRNA (guanine(966)-N(2))-methyltransferase RsmD [Verrucomicrobiota bacterium]|nr:16S rRNA (guanine(966)-N(2))-methyltransferase RsmD [Verrucomicrobiota bacterium]